MKNSIILALAVLGAALCAARDARAWEMVEFSKKGGQEIITLSLPEANPHKVFVLSNPPRIVIEVPSMLSGNEASLPADLNSEYIRSARSGQFTPQTSRIVFDLKKPAQVVNVTSQDMAMTSRITIALGAPGSVGARKAEAAPMPRFDPPPIDEEAKKPGKKDKAADKSKKAAKKTAKPLIVIDPGHGGIDPGAKGEGKTHEKDIVLDYAKALQARLLKSGRYRVLLTRTSDSFVMLRQRVAIARKAGASLFISLHADSAPEDYAHGLSVYTVSEQASDKETAALAARENKADILAGMDLSTENKDVADILISLAQRETINQAATLADLLVISLGDKVDLLVRPHRFAGFAVLKAPDIPSVLVEIGFLTNKNEEKLIRSKTHRDRVTSGLASGIDNYFKQNRIGSGE